MPGFEFHHHSLEFILLFASILMISSVLANRISSRFGVPALLLFLTIGMLAGSEGPGGIDFDNYSLAFSVGSVCLALILFDGGLRTSWVKIKPDIKLGVSLSFVGTVVTGILTGIFARYALNLTWVQGFLLGAIVSSTDAAAVFSILRAKGLSLKGSLKQLLEFEAGSNDPVAIFLTVGVLTYAAATESNTLMSFIALFCLQAGVGLAMGWLGGKAIRWVNNNIGIEYEGLYGVLMLGLVLFLFALTATLKGSGFLAVYVAGLYVGNTDLIHKGNTTRFVDGIAWMAQILVFVTLGLLVFPSKVLTLWKEGLLLAFFMMLVARPLSVFIAAPGKALKKRERIFVSWVGLRGAAPVILATLPWSVNFPNADKYFNLVFFVVIISVIFQGASIPWFAKKVGVTQPLVEAPPYATSADLLPAGFISIEMEVKNESRAENKRVGEVALPAGVLLTSIQRAGRYTIPHGDTLLLSGDRVWGLARASNLKALEELFGEAHTDG